MEEIMEEVEEEEEIGENGGVDLAGRSPTICHFNFLSRRSYASPAVDGVRREVPQARFSAYLSFFFSFWYAN